MWACVCWRVSHVAIVFRNQNATHARTHTHTHTHTQTHTCTYTYTWGGVMHGHECRRGRDCWRVSHVAIVFHYYNATHAYTHTPTHMNIHMPTHYTHKHTPPSADHGLSRLPQESVARRQSLVRPHRNVGLPRHRVQHPHHHDAGVCVCVCVCACVLTYISMYVVCVVRACVRAHVCMSRVWCVCVCS